MFEKNENGEYRLSDLRLARDYYQNELKRLGLRIQKSDTIQKVSLVSTILTAVSGCIFDQPLNTLTHSLIVEGTLLLGSTIYSHLIGKEEFDKTLNNMNVLTEAISHRMYHPEDYSDYNKDILTADNEGLPIDCETTEPTSEESETALQPFSKVHEEPKIPQENDAGEQMRDVKEEIPMSDETIKSILEKIEFFDFDLAIDDAIKRQEELSGQQPSFVSKEPQKPQGSDDSVPVQEQELEL